MAVKETKNDNKCVLDNGAAKPQIVVCEVCGHGNPEGIGLCEMCSNFLFDVEVKQNGNK